jgi:hypothetical protein
MMREVDERGWDPVNFKLQTGGFTSNGLVHGH